MDLDGVLRTEREQRGEGTVCVSRRDAKRHTQRTVTVVTAAAVKREHCNTQHTLAWRDRPIAVRVEIGDQMWGVEKRWMDTLKERSQIKRGRSQVKHAMETTIVAVASALVR